MPPEETMARRATVVALGLFAAGCAAAAVGACSVDDASGTAPDDAGADTRVTPVDTGAATTPCTGAVPVMTALDPVTSAQVEPDWSCYASNDAGTFLVLADDAGDDAADAADADVPIDAGPDSPAPADGGPDAARDAEADASTVPHVFKLEDFLSHTDTAGASVDLFYGPSATGAPDFRATTDATGLVTYVPPAGARLLTYRVNPRIDPTNDQNSLRPLFWYDNVIVKPPAMVVGYSITKKGTTLILSGILGSQQPDPGTATLVSGVRDCQAREVTGALVELIDDATGELVPTGKTAGVMHSSYFYRTFPNDKCSFTTANNVDEQAIWGAVNAPVNMPGHTHGYTVRIRGRRSTDATPVLLGEKSVELWPDTVTIARAFRLSPP
jgi:hypothetical protein